VGIQQDLLQPTKLAKQNGYLWADRRDSAAVANFDSAETREVYDVAHPAPWGWKIAAYLWTKSVAAGVLLIAALLMSLGGSGPMLNVVSPVIALVFLAATTALLVFDLKRPDRFFYLITKPNFRSWLVLGGYILMFYGAMAAVWLVMGVTQNHIPAIVVWPTVVLAIATAGYSAFLFGQAKGRDFWRHKWFTFWQLVIQALIAGSAVLEICFMQADSEDGVLPLNALLTISSILLVLGLANAILEIAVTRKTEEERIARRFLTQGAAGRRFRYSVMVLGLILPLLLSTFWVFVPIAIPIAAALALYGLFWFEYLWVQAGQAAPLS
jgi:formate-dependent nitrite reductase membrane component NrfD